jgi:hypothetical protein
MLMLRLRLIPLIALLISHTLSQDDYTSSYNFKLITYLKTNVDLEPSVDNYALNYHSPRSLSTPETNYYINGTYFDSFHSIATLWTDDSSHAINVSPDNVRDVRGRRTVYFSKEGQKGVGIRPYPGGIPDLYFGSSTFYACRIGGLGAQLFYRDSVFGFQPSQGERMF